MKLKLIVGLGVLVAVVLFIFVPIVPSSIQVPPCHCPKGVACFCPDIQVIPALDSPSYLLTGFGTQLYSMNGHVSFQFHFTQS